MALYRKYRPATFAEVVGQEHVTEPLSTALDAGRVNHAYLFSGPRGCGKTSSARILARSLNCESGPTSTPCGTCSSCVALAPGGPGNIDVIELDAASHGGVDDTRELRDRAFYAPAESRYRVFIVDEAHMVTTAGFNALLKIVEEPPEHLIFVFATTEPEKVLPTIRSRTHHYPFRLLPPSTMRALLERICGSEGVAVADAVYPLVIRAGGGSPRDSLSVLDQLLAGAGDEGVTYPRALALLGVTDTALIDEAVVALGAGDGAALFGTVNKVMEAGHDPRRFAGDLLERIRDLILLRAVPDAGVRGLVDAPADVLETMIAQAASIGPATLARYAELLHAGLGEMRGATAPRLLLEVVCARMLLPSASDAESAALQRLERLERQVTGGVVAAAPAGSSAAGTPATAPPAGSPGSAPRTAAAAPPAAGADDAPKREFRRASARSADPASPPPRADSGAPLRSESAAQSSRADSASQSPPRSEPEPQSQRADSGPPSPRTGSASQPPRADSGAQSSRTGSASPSPNPEPVPQSSGAAAASRSARAERPSGAAGPDAGSRPANVRGDRHGQAEPGPGPTSATSDREVSPGGDRTDAQSGALDAGRARGAAAVPADAQVNAADPEAVRTRWSDVQAKVRQLSPRAAAMLAEAVVEDVNATELVLSHKIAPLAARLVEPHIAGPIAAAMTELFGITVSVRTATAGAAPVKAAPAPRKAAKPAERAPRFERPSRAPEPGGFGEEDIPPPDEPDRPHEPEPVDEYSQVDDEAEMLAESARPVPAAQRRDPEDVALELLESELGARRIDG